MRNLPGVRVSRGLILLYCCVFFVFVLSGGRIALASPDLEGTTLLKLVDRSEFGDSRLELASSDWEWIRNKRVLVVGTASPNFAPLELVSNGMYYEGVTADTLGVLAKLLHIDVRVIQFPDRASAFYALEKGVIDVVGSSNNYEVDLYRVRLTQSYIKDQPVLYVRKSEQRSIPPDLNGMRVAIADDYLPLTQLSEVYPNAQFVLHRSREQAVASVAFGNADLYLGDSVSSNYFVNLNYFNFVRMLSRVEIPSGGFSFAFSPKDGPLESVLNKALIVVRDRYSDDILKRWSGGGSSISFSKVDLSPSEQRWIIKHPVVRFIVTGDTAPLSYFDSAGQFSGVGADLLKSISLRTGLVFEPVQANEQDDYLSYVESGQADVTFLVSTEEREEKFLFTRPALFTSYAIVTRNVPGQPASVTDLKGKRLALPRNHALRELLQPSTDYKFVDADTLPEAMEMVANGEADATATFLPVAQYYVMNFHSGDLKISNIVDNTPASVAFAVNKRDLELASILDKVLLQIPPDEIDVFQNRWRPKVDVSQGAWWNHRELIYKIAGAAFVLILLSFAWNFYIRSQFKRRQLAESALNEQLIFMNSLINGTPHPIYVRDHEGRMVTCNSSYLEVFDTTLETIVGKTALEGGKINRQEALEFYDDYMRVMRSGEPLEIDRLLHLPSRVLNIYHWIYPYYSSRGQVKGVICGWVDISDRRRLTEELRAALDAADESGRVKTTFLATMSHEIRTPLSAVIGMLELALKQADQGKFDRPAIDVAYDSARGLLELIGDILDVVRIESGHINLSPKRANLRELVESVARVFDGLARQKALMLTLQIDASVNCDVLVDPMRFKQVLSNLVGNAIKFTDTGEVKVVIAGSLTEDERLRVRMSVEDTGIGISPEELSKLFQPFVQANHGRTSRGGTGLGLAICKSLAELMGGELSTHSVVGKGTSVTLDVSFSVLPALEGGTIVEEKVAQTEHPSLNVLVVDDQQANRVLLTQQLSFFGQSVSSAENGERGLEQWQEHSFDVIFTDCNMPVMDGYEMVRAIRMEEQRQSLPRCTIIGFTANAQPEEKVKCLDAGMDDCLFKPVSLTLLSGLLMSLGSLPKKTAIQSEEVILPVNDKIESILRDLTGGDPEMIQMLANEASNSYTQDLAELRTMTQNLIPDALIELADLAHRIKGAARIFQARKVVNACDHIENLCTAVPFDREAILAHSVIVEAQLEELIVQVQALSSTSRS